MKLFHTIIKHAIFVLKIRKDRKTLSEQKNSFLVVLYSC